jgi:hypothetical protein
LTHTHDSVQNKNGEDDCGINKGGPTLAFFEKCQDEGNAGRCEKDNDKLVLELF